MAFSAAYPQPLEVMKYRIVTKRDVKDWLSLAFQLWPEYSQEELLRILLEILISKKEDGVILRAEDDLPIAFMNLSLRFDHVPGAKKSPVAYIEGIYVIEEFKNKGIARGLIEFAEKWAIEHGCRQLASDALLDNTISQEFHTKVGFSEVERTVAFIKPVITDH